MATKSKLKSLSTRRCTRSGAIPEPVPTPPTFSTSVPEPNSTPGTDKPPRTPFSVNSITPGTIKSVTLSDWWLTKKPNENSLGVSGYEYKDGSESRLFSSGPISARHDSTTLETSDGFTVSINGFIDESRTLRNGFSSEVCSRFLLGFPYHWRDYAEEGFVEEEEEKKGLNVSFDDIPVNLLHDVRFMSSPLFKGKILDDAVHSLRDLLRPGTRKPDKECERSDKDDGNEESLDLSVVGVKTRGMIKRRDEHEASIGERVHRSSKKKKQA